MKVAFAVCLLALFGQCFVQGDDAVDDYTKWSIDPTNGIVDQCNNNKVNPHDSCMKAANGTLKPGGDGTATYHENSGNEPTKNDGSGSWDAMCAALVAYSCDDPEALDDAITESNACCTNVTICPEPGSDDVKDGRSKCCGQCIAENTPPAPPSSPDSSNSEDSGNTTVKTGDTTTAPAPTTTPGPVPEDTTTMEPSTTEGGSDSDSAINLGASGLLVTLITMMAAGVNIA